MQLRASAHRPTCLDPAPPPPPPPPPPPTTPTAPQLIAIYACFVLLARNMSNKSAPILFIQLVVAGLLGAALALAVQYLTLAANGGTYADSATKASIEQEQWPGPCVESI